MGEHRTNAEFFWCLAGSLALHASLIGGAMVLTMSGAIASSPDVVPIKPEELQRPLPAPVEMQLGLDAPNPPSPTWVGYDQYQKQLATLSEVEQAAFTDDPVAGGMPASDMSALAPKFDSTQAAAAKQLLTQAPEPVTPAPEPSPPTPTPPPPAPPTPQPKATSASDLERLLALNSLLAPMIEPSRESKNDRQPPQSQPDQTPPVKPPTSQPEPEKVADAAEASKQPPQTQPADATAPPPPTEPSETISRSTAGAPNTGAQSDRESDPTSTIDVPREFWQLGKPLAAHGLELKPRRPEVTVLTQLTAWPRNPTGRITFDRTGVPTLAVLLVDTGDSRVDAAIIAALYRWRASGEPLKQLADGQTIDITIRLLINAERKRIDGDK